MPWAVSSLAFQAAYQVHADNHLHEYIPIGAYSETIRIVNDIIAFLLDAGVGLTGRPIDEINYDVYYNINNEFI